MKDTLYITGHKNPDTDSICAAIAYAEFKNKTGNIKAIPIRLGEVNRESQFILDYFDVEKPLFVETMKTQISDLNIDNIAAVSPEISLRMAWEIMKKNDIKTLPVTDRDNKLIGLASITDLANVFTDIWDSGILAKSNTPIENILDTLSAIIIYSEDQSPKYPGKILVAAMEPDSAKKSIEPGDIVICGNREDTQEAIIEAKASMMIVTGNPEVSESIIEKAKANNCSILSTPYDTYTTSKLITQSIPVGYVMAKNNIIKFREDDLVDDIKDIMLKTRFRSYPVVDATNHVVGSISRYHLISQTKKNLILVDHNEKTQSVDGIEDAVILEIIDHHRIADIQTGLPIYFRNEPVGSTSTIVASIFFENGIRPSKKTAGILVAAIISDTLMFRSPTSTNIDRLVLKRLTEIVDIDVEKFAENMFKAGTSLKGKTMEEIFHQDFKVFTLVDLKVGVSQVGTMDIEGFESMKEEMLVLMNKKASENHFNVLILMLTNILKDGSELLIAGENKDLVSKTFNTTIENDCVYLPGILSRKKQIIPPLTDVISSLRS